MLASEAIAQRPAQHRPRRYRRKENEEMYLRARHGEVEFLDEIEGEIAGKRREIDKLGEDQDDEDP